MWFSADVTGVLIGVVSSFLWLLVLFGIKPSLRLTWEEGFPSGKWWRLAPTGRWWRCSPSGTWAQEPVAPRRKCRACGTDMVHYRIEVENLGLARVVEIETRLWSINGNGLRKREKVPIEVDELLELNGKWQEARRKSTETGDRFFHFRLPCSVSAASLGSRDHLLFQIRSKHGFTNFGRVQKLRIKPNLSASASPFNYFDTKDPDSRLWRRRSYACLATVVASIAVRKHIHSFRLVGSYRMDTSGRQLTVAKMHCPCGAMDYKSLLGSSGHAPALRVLGSSIVHKATEVGHPKKG